MSLIASFSFFILKRFLTSLIVLLSILGKYKDFLVLPERTGPFKGMSFLGLGRGIGILDLFGLVIRTSNYFRHFYSHHFAIDLNSLIFTFNILIYIEQKFSF